MFVTTIDKKSTVIQLLIILSLLVIGKLHGQETIIPQLINKEFLSPPVPLNYMTQTSIVVPGHWQIEAERSQNPMQRAAYVERITPPQSVSSPPDERKETTKRKLSTQKPDKMSQPPTRERPTSANTSVGNTHHNDDIETNYDRVTSEENDLIPVSNLKQPSQVPETNQNSTVNVKKNLDPKETSSQSMDKKPEVTVDERALFDGDPCPTGYVRVNGKCVEKDT